MARYYLHLRDGSDQLLDPEGVEFSDLDAVRKAVLEAARDVMCGDLRNGIFDLRFRIDAEDEQGCVVYSLPFEYAVNIIQKPDGPTAS